MNRWLSIDHFWYIKIHTWLRGSGNKTKEMYNTLLNLKMIHLVLFVTKLRSQVWILIHRNWPQYSKYPSQAVYIYLRYILTKIWRQTVAYFVYEIWNYSWRGFNQFRTVITGLPWNMDKIVTNEYNWQITTWYMLNYQKNECTKKNSL